MNLLNELTKTAKTNAERIIAEQDAILNAVKDNLAIDEGKDLDMLKHFGTHKVMTDAKSVRNKNISYTKGNFLSQEDIKSVCNRYALKCLPTFYYQNQVPMTALNDMRNFEKDNKVVLNGGEFPGRWGVGDKEPNLFIIAPKTQFALTDRPKDPVLLYREYGGVYRIISSWGNDFNFTQRIIGYLTANEKLLKLTISTMGFIAGLDLGYKGSCDHGNYETPLGIIGFIVMMACLFFTIVTAVGLDMSDKPRYNEPFRD